MIIALGLCTCLVGVASAARTPKLKPTTVQSKTKTLRGLQTRKLTKFQKLRRQQEAPSNAFRALFVDLPRLTIRSVRRHPKSFLKGFIVGGPKHTVVAIRQHKLAFGLGLTSVALVGGASNAIGFNSEPYILSAGTGLLGYQLRLSLQHLHGLKLRGARAAMFVGERIGFPTVLVASSSVAGLMIGDHGAAPPGTSVVTKATTGAASSALLGGDGPAVLATALSEHDH